MILNNSIHKSHYDVLGVREDANYEHIRTVYRSAILSFHPDKLHDNNHTSDAFSSSKHDKTKETFLEIQKAWEILSDHRSRAVYDNELRSLRQDASSAEDLGFDDLQMEVCGGGDDVIELSYPCRCGDFYVIDSLDLANMGYPLVKKDGREIFTVEASKDLPVSVVLPCGSCSLKVRLLISPDSKLASTSGP
ncbi:unnamed protein product [Cuscuta epithymum]|uniref:DPH4 homolog n=1 Tax=Cuscuta epithymum TaxID=186058 RepID=A0AAV0CI87_9ASTE|nr:unnamed protein product [Cuscuta epithymum]CAH9131870.1 unnamed protein product [Cuscuta epithymum]